MGMLKWLSSKIRRRNPASERHSRISTTLPRHDNGDIIRDLHYYQPLYRAALRGNWEDAREFFNIDSDAVTAKITEDSETALHIAVGTGKSNDFVGELIELMPMDSLGLTNKNGETALSVAAIVGNVEAAKLLIDKNKFLPYIWSMRAKSPLHRAALYGHREMVSFLLSVTKDNVGRNPYSDKCGILLLKLLTKARLYDQAVKLFQSYSMLEALREHKTDSPLAVLANQPSAFRSGSSLNCCQRLVYFCIPLKSYILPHSNRGDVENQTDNNQVQHEQMCCWARLRRVCRDPCTGFWHVIAKLVPWIRNIKETKMMHYEARELFKCICREVSLLDHKEVEALLKEPLLSAATLGIKEIVVDILDIFPPAIWYIDKGSGLFQLAVLNRQENIFRLIYHMSGYQQLVTKFVDSDKNNILHLAGKLAPPHRLNLISGAVLQMQHELQWFEKVEKLVEPSYKEMKNKDGQTPEMLFIEAHKDLVIEAKEWMKGTANSCTTAATLIATVVFAAAITVPGGNNSTGSPLFSQAKAFTVFAIADAASLFSSIASVLMFLGILSSRYFHTDFLYTLPQRLVIGLLTLFLSISSLMVAFTATIYLVIGHGKSRILIIMGVLAGLPVSLFVFSQTPLLWAVIRSTYGPCISSWKWRKRIVY